MVCLHNKTNVKKIEVKVKILPLIGRKSESTAKSKGVEGIKSESAVVKNKSPKYILLSTKVKRNKKSFMYGIDVNR